MNLAQRTLAIALLLSFATGVAAQEDTGAQGKEVQLFAGAQREADRRARELRRQAVRNLGQKRFPMAIQNLKELVAMDPYEADYHISLGVLHTKTRNYDEARRKFQDFIDLGGNLAVAHLLMAETYVQTQDRDRAFSHFRQAAENGLNLMKAAQESPALNGFSHDTEFIKLALQLEQYQLNPGKLRDPMTQTFRRVSQEAVADVPQEEQLNHLSKEQQEQVLKGAKRCLIRIEIFLSRDDEDRAMDAYRELQGYIEQEGMITVPLLASEFRAIVEQKEQIENRIKEIRIKYYYGEAQQLVSQMERAFNQQDFSQVEAAHVEGLKVADSMVEIDSRYEPVAQMIVKVSSQWLERSKIREEFESKTLRIQGIVCQRDDTPFAILNNRVMNIGDSVDGMQLIQIEKNQLVFDFKGEEIPLTFRRY